MLSCAFENALVLDEARPSMATADSSFLCRYAELNARATSYVKGDQELHLTLEKDEKDKIFLHTTAFARSAKMRDAALALYVNAKVGLEHCLNTHHSSFGAFRLVVGALLLPTHHCRTALQISAILPTKLVNEYSCCECSCAVTQGLCRRECARCRQHE